MLFSASSPYLLGDICFSARSSFTHTIDDLKRLIIQVERVYEICARSLLKNNDVYFIVARARAHVKKK